MITRYSIVCQVPGAAPYTVCPYSGMDLSQVLGITQADLPGGYYGWIQERGEAVVRAGAQTQAAYVDFSPNVAKLRLTGGLPKGVQEQPAGLPSDPLGAESSANQRDERASQLPPLLIEVGSYCRLLREARDVFVDGHFYACVALCGISLERFQRDKARPYGAGRKDHMSQVRTILTENHVLKVETLALCKKMATLRNDYAHGDGPRPEEDALRALEWMHAFIDNETSLMRDYVIVEGVLSRSGC